MVRIHFENCADETTADGAFAYVNKTAKVTGKVGYWGKVGHGAVVLSDMGNWSSVGPFAHVGSGVTFGPWASVGALAIVDAGAKLGSHEYVRSGTRRKANGKTVEMQFDTEDRAFMRLYDRAGFGWDGPSVMTNEEAKARDDERLANRRELSALMGGFIDRNRNRTHRSGLWGMVMNFMRPEGW